jgi:hypothetical protein
VYPAAAALVSEVLSILPLAAVEMIHLLPQLATECTKIVVS